MKETKASVSEIASLGGLARKDSLSPEDRSQIARHAVETRWRKEGKTLPQATHGSEDHPLRIGEIEIPCYVLDDGRRMLVQRGMLIGLDMKQGTAGRGSGDRLAKFIAGKAINPFVPGALSDVIINPVKFRTTNGSIAYGYEATVLADLCDSVLEARKNGKLNYQSEHIAERCEVLVRGFARVGIIALVDEATGFQEIRDRLTLQAILDKFLRKEFAAWAKRFPDEFYQQIFRLRGWQWKGMKINRPQIVAHYTKDLVYKRLTDGLVKELESRNPMQEQGYRKAKHHQWLTEDIGHPALSQHLYAVIGLMRIANSWDQFKRMIDRAYPKRGASVQSVMFDDDPDFEDRN